MQSLNLINASTASVFSSNGANYKPLVGEAQLFNDMDKYDLTGQKFTALTVMSLGGKNKRGHKKWLCKCECGNESLVEARNLKNGHTTSCGCYKLRATTIHGHGKKKQSPEYVCWHSMLQRCLNKKCNGYKGYGQKGITVCSEWFNFVNFLKDMGARPSPKHSIDRINNNGNYEPSNCRWATNGEQLRNRSNTVFIEYRGKKLIAADWSKITGLRTNTIRCRWLLGLSSEIILTTPIIKGKKNNFNKFKNE